MACGSFEYLAANSGLPCGLGQVQRPPDHTVFTPFIELNFRNQKFTVGNEGANNQAVIESLNLNVISNEGGMSGKITIVTCDYNDVLSLLGLIPKSQCHYDEYFLGGDDLDGYINVGWIFQDCDTGVTSKSDIRTENNAAIIESGDGELDDLGPFLYCLFTTGSFSFEEGYYKVDLDFTFVADAFDMFRNEVIEGTEDQKQKLWPAINSMVKKRCDETEANLDVMKLRLSADSKSFQEWNFKPSDGGKSGPYGVWNPDQLNNTDAARKIMLSFVTDKEKATSFIFPNQTKNPSLLVFEDINPNICLGEKRKCPVKTFIVNGGDCTKVLKFTPEVNQLSLTEIDDSENDGKIYAGRGGGGPNAFSTVPERINICEIKLDEQTGNFENKQNMSSNGRQVELPTNSGDLNFRPPSQVLNQLSAAVSTNLAASDNIEGLPPVKATMEIIGDPYYTGILNIVQEMFIQVIFINPFCIKQNGANGDCEYLAEPPVNSILSGIYRIAGANHNITKGSFITTLELQRLGNDEDFLS